MSTDTASRPVAIMAVADPAAASGALLVVAEHLTRLDGNSGWITIPRGAPTKILWIQVVGIEKFRFMALPPGEKPSDAS